MKKLQKRFAKKDGTIQSICTYACLCSCAAIGCEGDVGSELHIRKYNVNKTRTNGLMKNAG